MVPHTDGGIKTKIELVAGETSDLEYPELLFHEFENAEHPELLTAGGDTPVQPGSSSVAVGIGSNVVSAGSVPELQTAGGDTQVQPGPSLVAVGMGSNVVSVGSASSASGSASASTALMEPRQFHKQSIKSWPYILTFRLAKGEQPARYQATCPCLWHVEVSRKASRTGVPTYTRCTKTLSFSTTTEEDTLIRRLKAWCLDSVHHRSTQDHQRRSRFLKMPDQSVPTDAALELSLADFDAAPPEGHLFAHLHKKRRGGSGDTTDEASGDSSSPAEVGGRQRSGSGSNSSSSSTSTPTSSRNRG